METTSPNYKADMKFKTFLSLVAALFFMLGFNSCAALTDLFGEGAVVTNETQLVEGAVGEPIPYDQLPEEIKSQVPEGTVLVLADREDIIEDGAYVPLTPGDGDLGPVLDTLIALGVTFIPGLAAWEGILTLVSRRKRKNYAKAIKALAPTDSKVDLGEGLAAVAAALGAAHTSEASKQAAEEEEELI